MYYAGAIIEGKVILELSEQKKMQGISIVMSGLAYVCWSENYAIGTGEDQRTKTVTYTDSETFFNPVSIQLCGNGRDSQNVAAGRYEFPFKFQLPSSNLPTSYESKTGYIRYSLTSTISRSWNINHTTKRAITVNEIVDINTPYLAAELSSSNEKTLCCLCCASGPISLSVTTDRGGYCPGESIAISTEAENHSDSRVSAVQASLKQEVSYYVDRHSCSFRKVVQKVEGPGIAAGRSSNWSKELLPVPAIVPTIDSCRILKLSYYLVVTLVIPGARDLHVSIPVTIGNVPFRGQDHAAHNGNSYIPPPYLPQPHTENPPSASLTYSAVYPPVYIGDDNYTMGETQYAPVYGFVTDYPFVTPSYSEAVVKVMGGEN